MTVSRIPAAPTPAMKRVVKDAEEKEADVRQLYFNNLALLIWRSVSSSTTVEQEGTR